MVTIRSMTQQEFGQFLARSISEYGEEKVRAGNWTAAEAERRSVEDHERLLPDGLSSRHQHLYTIEFQGKAVGDIWLCSDPSLAGGAGFIFDVYVDEGHRRRGIGEAAMRLLETEALNMGLNKLALHVFGYNHSAQALYDKLGYSITNLNMAKSLGSSG